MSKKIHVVVVKATGDAEMLEVERDLDGLKACIGGGWLEPITAGVPVVDWVWTGYCDEEGKIKAQPRNYVADDLAVSMGWMGRAAGDFLVGDVVFVGGVDQDGNDTSVPPEMMRHFLDWYNAHGEVVTGAEAEGR